MMRYIVALLFWSVIVVASQTTSSSKEDNVSQEQNATQIAQQIALKEQKAKEEKEAKERQIQQLLAKINELEQAIQKERIWTKSYASYLTSLKVEEQLQTIEQQIKKLKRYKKNPKKKAQLETLESKAKILNIQLEEFRKKGSAPFAELLTPPKIDNPPEVSNPFVIFNAISFLKTAKGEFESYVQRKEELEQLIQQLKKEITLYKELYNLTQNRTYQQTLQEKQQELEKFLEAYDILSVTADVYKKRLEVIEVNLNKDIKSQIYKLINIAVIVFVVFFIFFVMKMIAKRYIADNERFYMVNKFITFTNFTVILLILFFNYIENASYIVTILGFASAGIAIAMKDWFMSILGWLVIMFGGSIHVGDRIRVDMDGMRYIGDVLDISLLRITILEDITLTSVMQNRRAGRIIFIPNNYIFTRMIANYTHASLKTVWDGIKITITFDSNHKKAMHIMKEIAKKYSKGYTDITRKQLNKLRHQYNLKNTNVEPRIYSFIEPHGIDIEIWYLTNAYATLTLRSTISTEILDSFKAEDDITIAYPTQNININKNFTQTMPSNGELV